MSGTWTVSTATERTCFCGCGLSFTPTRSHQKFHPGHQKPYWQNLMRLATELDQGRIEMPSK